MSNQDSLLLQMDFILSACGPLVQRILRITRWQQQEQSKCEAFWVLGPVWLHGSYALTCPESPCVLPKCTVNERSQIHIPLFMEQNEHFNLNKSENLLTRIPLLKKKVSSYQWPLLFISKCLFFPINFSMISVANKKGAFPRRTYVKKQSSLALFWYIKK